MKKFKQILTLVLALTMMLTCVSTNGITALAADDNSTAATIDFDSSSDSEIWDYFGKLYKENEDNYYSALSDLSNEQYYSFKNS